MAINRLRGCFDWRRWVQMRLDAFNVANHANFNNPNTTLTSASFGRITGSGGGRVLQVSMKCAF